MRTMFRSIGPVLLAIAPLTAHAQSCLGRPGFSLGATQSGGNADPRFSQGLSFALGRR